MCALPIVSGSEVSTPSTGVKMDTGAFRDAALAPGKVAAQLGQDVGGFFKDLSEKMQQNKNTAMVLGADLDMRKTKDQFDAEKAKMPDPNTWVPAWTEKVAQLKQKVLDNPQAGPDVKRQLAQKFDIWQGATTGEINVHAALKTASDNEELAIENATYAAHQGDVSGANDSINASLHNNVISPAKAESLRRELPGIAATSQADAYIANDPIHALESIKSLEKDLGPVRYLSAQRAARAAQNAARSQNLDELSQDMDSALDGAIDPKVIKDKVAAGEITQRGADSLMARMKRTELSEAKDTHSLLMMRADDHDWVGDKDPQQTARDLKDESAALPPALRKSVNEHIDAKVTAAKKAGTAAEKPVEKAIYDRMKEDREDNAAFVPINIEETPEKKGFFFDTPATTVTHHIEGGLKTLRNLTDEQVAEQIGKGATFKSVMQAEQLQYAKQMTKMRDWFKANPEATEEQAEEYRQTLVKPLIYDAVSKSFGGQASAEPKFTKGQRVNQNGVNYEFDGKNMNEVK